MQKGESFCNFKKCCLQFLIDMTEIQKRDIQITEMNFLSINDRDPAEIQERAVEHKDAP